jgi:hypothetical protein
MARHIDRLRYLTGWVVSGLAELHRGTAVAAETRAVN